MVNLNRRDFLTGAALTAAGAMSCGMLASCAAGDRGEDSAARASDGPDSSTEDVVVQETLDADIVVVGAGISGLAASVQAAELGAKVVQLEVNGNTGGNGQGTEGIFAIGSDRQREEGIDLTLADIVASEQDFFKYKVNALYWKDMVEQSAETLKWLEGNGVEFSGLVDDYPPLGAVKTMHWWKDGNGLSYINPMTSKAEELGVDIRLSTRGFKLIKEGDRISGIYAKDAKNNVTQINAKAVILATGGFADNPDKLSSLGIHSDEVFVRSFGGHMGDGLDMAVEAGAQDRSVLSAFLRETTVGDIEFASPFSIFFFSNGSLLWVNENGERFADENCLSITSGCMSNANSNQTQPYGIFSRAILEEAGEEAVAQCEEAIGEGNAYVFSSDTVDGLAEKMGVPAKELAETVDRYNSFCETGVDEDFGKAGSALVKLDPPYYGVRFQYCYMSSIGGIHTSRHAEVLDAQAAPIPGLYAVGSDGCELYYGTYTISVCSSYNGNNVYSGRNAARNACEYMAQL